MFSKNCWTVGIFWLVVCQVHCQNSTVRVKATGNDSKLLEKWKQMDSMAKSNTNLLIKAILPRIMESSGKVNLSATCTSDMFKLISGVKNLRAWAFKFLDASGKGFDGLFSGTLGSLGDYDQCLDSEAINERKGRHYGKVMFQGKYCALDFKPVLPPKNHFYRIDNVLEELKNIAKEGTVMSEIVNSAHFFYFLAVRAGVCVPSGCSESDIQGIADSVLGDSSWTANVKWCEIKEDVKVTAIMIAVMVLFSTLGFLMILGTMIDLIYRSKRKSISNRGVESLCCFSILANFRKLVNTKNATGPLRCLNGIRFLAISWIVLAHTYLNINLQTFRGLRRVAEYPKDFAFQAIVNAAVSVDTFFLMSGLLICYATMKLVRDDKNPFNIGLYLLHRYIRLVPIYAVVIAFLFLGPLLSSGPIWHETVDKYINACYKNWWTNFLFVNNFVDAENMCLIQSWYVACDMQLYVFALIILLPMLRWPKIGLLLATLTILASVVASAVITYIKDFPPAMLFVHPDEEQRISYWSSLYFKPYPHAGPFCIGIMTGYLLATKPTLQIPMPVRIIGWIAAIICNMAVLYGAWGWNKGEEINFWGNMMYSGCHRIGWAFGLAWIVVCCFYGYGGIVNYILCWNVWIPLSRLTYGIYLIHPISQIMFLGSIRERVMTNHFFAVWIYFGHLLATTGSAFAGSMLIEAPILSLEKVWMRKKFPQSHSTQNGKQISSIEENGEIGNELNVRNGTSKHTHVSRL